MFTPRTNLKTYRVFSILAVFALVLGSFTFAIASPSPQETSPVASYDVDDLDVYMPPEEELSAQAADATVIPGEYIVTVNVKEGTPSADYETMSTAVSALGGSIAQTSVAGNAYLLRFKDTAQGQTAFRSLQSMQGVLYVEPNHVVSSPAPVESFDRQGDVPTPEVTLNSKQQAYQAASQPVSTEISAQDYTPNDSSIGLQWFLDKILYNLSPAPAGNFPCVVVIDSGVYYDHWDLEDKIYLGYDSIDLDYDPDDPDGHGTHVAGIVGALADNRFGGVGVSPLSNILAVRVLDENGDGSDWSVTEGIKYANQAAASACGGQEPRIYNMSLGSSNYSYNMAVALATANQMGRLVVAAAGNANTSVKHYPAAFPSTFSVGATDQNDYRVYFSNYDSTAVPWVDIAAPGYQILSTRNDADENINSMQWYTLNGTSQASPVVAGVAARVWAKYPGLTAEQVANRLVNTADPAYGFPRTAIKRVNLYRALGFSTRLIQGRIVGLDGDFGQEGATVNVKRYATGQTICTMTTKEYGFFTCAGLPSVGKYGVSVSKAGYAVNQQAYYVAASKWNALFTISADNGTTGDFNWSVTLQWPAWTPFTKDQYDLDFWAVERGGTCYDNGDGVGGTQADRIEVDASDDGVYNVIAVNYGGGYNGDDTSRITASKAQVRIYRNNYMQRFINVPVTPATNTADNWHVININTINNRYLFVNQILTPSQIPACIVDGH